MWGKSIPDKEASAKALRQSVSGSARSKDSAAEPGEEQQEVRAGSGSPDPRALPAAHRGDLGFASESLGTTGEWSRDVP